MSSHSHVDQEPQTETVSVIEGPRHRNLSPRLSLVIKIIVIGVYGFVAYTTVFGQLPNIQQYSVILFLCLAMGFIFLPASAKARDKVAWYDWLGIVLVGAACLNVFVNYWPIMLQEHIAGPLDYFLGVVMIVSSAELARRSIGNSFAILIVLFTCYALFGHLIPGKLGHGGASWQSVLDMLYLSTNGMWGLLTDIFSSLLILFIMLGAAMLATGVSDTFMDLAKYIGGRFRGGPAKISVISSALMGSITGSSVTNVAMTGTITIPMMKRLGYKPEVAAGIEATASSGGQITPPLMGAGLFLMAEMLEVPVQTVMVLAIAPALLFYLSVLSAVHFDSARENIKALPKEEIPAGASFRSPKVWLPVTVPFVVLISMIVNGNSIYLSVLYTIAAMITVFLALSSSFSEIKEKALKVISALADSAESLISMAALIVAAGILVGVISYLGIGIKFSGLILDIGGGSLIPTLLLAAVVVMIMGMGIPTTAAYVLAVSVVIVAFKKLGVGELQTHMFLFYFATLSAITPPVCGAVFVAANIAKAPWLKVAGHTMRFASIKYLMPFLFIFHPGLLMEGDITDILFTLGCVTIGTFFLSAGFSGYLLMTLSTPLRIIVIMLSIMAMWPDTILALIGIAGCIAFVGMNFIQARRHIVI